MSFLNPPTAAIRRRRLLVGGASVLLTATVMVGFLVESRWGYSPKDVEVIYVQSWKADRSRADTIADNKATIAAQQAKLAQARAYIATLSGEARKKAQDEYDRYVEGGAIKKAIPFVSASGGRDNAAQGIATLPATDEPPVL